MRMSLPLEMCLEKKKEYLLPLSSRLSRARRTSDQTVQSTPGTARQWAQPWFEQQSGERIFLKDQARRGGHGSAQLRTVNRMLSPLSFRTPKAVTLHSNLR